MGGDSMGVKLKVRVDFSYGTHNYYYYYDYRNVYDFYLWLEIRERQLDNLIKIALSRAYTCKVCFAEQYVISRAVILVSFPIFLF